MGRGNGPGDCSGPEHDMVRENLTPRIALVLGGAACVYGDIDEALTLGEFAGVVACNDIAAHWPGDLDAMVTLHPEKLLGWIKDRERNGYSAPRRIFLKREWRER